MIEVKTPINPIITYGDDSEEQKISRENEILINSYYGEKDVGVHV